MMSIIINVIKYTGAKILEMYSQLMSNLNLGTLISEGTFFLLCSSTVVIVHDIVLAKYKVQPK